MSIVQRLVERMGGTVALRSAVGVGTRVEVRLPLRERPAGDCAAALGPAPATDGTQRLRVLAADGRGGGRRRGADRTPAPRVPAR